MSIRSTPRTLDFSTVDVFAQRLLEGNQLAIFPDARRLSTADMQAIARETNLSETSFILPGDPATERTEGVQVRIFTTEEELPFAGHPTLGTASWLHWHHPTLRGASEIRLRLAAGTVPVHFHPPDPHQPGIFATMRQNDPTFGQLHTPDHVARALGLTLADLDPSLPIQTVSTGLPFAIVPLRSLAAAGRLSIPQADARRYLARTDAHFFFCIAPADPAGGAAFHARMQFSNGEDPATGSASGCAIAYLVHHGRVPSGRETILEQGVEIHRPSRIHLRATRIDDRTTDVFVGGRTIPVATGRFFLPSPESYSHPPQVHRQ